MPTYNVTLLGQELVDAWDEAGIPADGIVVSIHADGTIDWSAAATQQHMDIAVTVIANYAELIQDDLAIIMRKAKALAKNAAIIASVTPAQAANWQQNNITVPLAQAETAINAATTLGQLRLAFLDVIAVMEKMDALQRGDIQLTIALRDRVLPDLRE